MQVLVIGAGVAGSAAAIALRQVGAEVTVYESAPEPAGSVGSFLSLAVNGLRGLADLDCLEPIRDAGIEVPRQRLWSSSGKLLGDVPRGRLSGDSLNSVTLRRSDLVDLLRQHAVRAGAEFVTGIRLTRATATAHGVRAEFASGAHAGAAPASTVLPGTLPASTVPASTGLPAALPSNAALPSAVPPGGLQAGGFHAEADLLVGADGIWSTTRGIIDPAAPTPRYAGMYSVSGLADGLAITPGVFNLVFARNGAFLYVADDNGAIWWSAQVSDPHPPDLDAVDLPTLTGLFRHEEMPSAILRAATSLEAPTRFHVLAPVPTWHTSRMVLVGDAAHPVGAGQGASMAIEDAVVLGDRLAPVVAADPGAELEAGLAEYVQARRTRTVKMIKAASANRDAKTAGPIGRRVNDVVMPFMLRYFYEKATAWLYTESDPVRTRSSR